MELELSQDELELLSGFNSLSEIDEWKCKLARRYKAKAISAEDKETAQAWITQMENSIYKMFGKYCDEK